MPKVRDSLRVPAFKPLAASYAINELGDNLGVVALAILVLDETGSAMGTAALFLAARFIPAFVAPALTAALDRRPAGQILPLLYAIEGAVFVALAAVAGSFSLPLVLVLAFADGLLALTARGLSRGAIAAALEPAGLLREGNALLNIAFAVAGAAGPALAGILVATGGVELTLYLDAASFIAVAMLLMRAGDRLPATQARAAEAWWTRLQGGLSYARNHGIVRRLVTGEAIAIVFFTVIVPIDVVYAKETLDAGNIGFGLLLAAWGVGILAGSAIFARARGRPLGTLIVASTGAIAVGYAAMAVAPTLLLACLAGIVGGAGNGVQWVAVMTALQESVAEDFQARISGMLESIAAAAPGIGYLAGGLLTAAASPRLAYAVAAAGVLAVVVAWARRPIVPGGATA